uniref:ATP synthase F0 subunit 8 n=1 Tax=Macrovipera schweizeri TaxID=110205 RepID=A0A5C2A0R0_9SAUR|nr:ATP synthase F0 subunit 8 [Macrovipera schweizeri]QEO33827.1 ATP synthase F0 subunit 8 [Macrovipera schweizeri]
MPQLHTIHILYIYVCTWLIITLISQKMGLLMLTTKPKNPDLIKNQLKTSTLPWS